MLSFLANIVDQLDLACEHVRKGDANNARFGLMLTDNAVELVLHQIAKDQHQRVQQFEHVRRSYDRLPALERALGQHFESKAKFAKLEGHISEERAESINILHSLRNQLHHVGVHHEAVLPALSEFYVHAASELFGKYQPPWFSFSLEQKLPERAAKYFTVDYGLRPEVFHEAVRTLGDSVDFQAPYTIAVMADHLDEIVEEQDLCLRSSPMASTTTSGSPEMKRS